MSMLIVIGEGLCDLGANKLHLMGVASCLSASWYLEDETQGVLILMDFLLIWKSMNTQENDSMIFFVF